MSKKVKLIFFEDGTYDRKCERCGKIKKGWKFRCRNGIPYGFCLECKEKIKKTEIETIKEKQRHGEERQPARKGQILK